MAELHPIKVLLVDDQPMVGETVRRTRSTDFAVAVLSFLESAGYAHAPRHLGARRCRFRSHQQ